MPTDHSWGEPRFFAYWRAAALDAALEEAGFDVALRDEREGTSAIWHVRVARPGRGTF